MKKSELKSYLREEIIEILSEETVEDINKKKEAQDAQAAAARQSAIQKDITQEQSEIVGQARQTAAAAQQQTASLEAARVPTGIPIAQSGAEPK